MMRRGGPGRDLGKPVVRVADMKGTLKKLLRYLGGSKHLLLGLIAAVVIVTLISVIAPIIQARAIDSITISQTRLAVDMQGLVKNLTVLGGIYLVSVIFTYLQTLLVAHLSQSTVRRMRNDLFSKISHLPIKFIDTHQHGDIMSRMTNDVDNISNMVSQSLGSLISGVITIIGTLIIMLIYSRLLTLASMVSVILSVTATLLLSKYMRIYFPRQQRLLGKLNGHIEEMVTGYNTVVAFGREPAAEEEFGEICKEYKGVAIRAQILGGVMGPIMGFIGNFGYLIVAAVGGWMAFNGNISIGIVSAFMVYSRQFSRPINELANQFAIIQTAIAGAERVFDIMDAQPEIDEGTSDISIEDMEGNISFSGIDFSYVPDQRVLTDFNLDVRSGRKIALVGATGSGKTTIVNLLERFYETDAGSILIDGVDIRDIPKPVLRGAIAIVLQDTIIFSDTIAQNIRYGNLNATDEEVEHAAEMAQVDDFVKKLPDGYETHLSESGGNISQGQRQLLSIARAVLADPKILILDEATSSIDTRTEVQIQKAMLNLMQGRTSLVIAHRLSTIRDADAIVVINQGRVVEIGTHDELITQKGEYFNLYQSQFAGIET